MTPTENGLPTDDQSSSQVAISQTTANDRPVYALVIKLAAVEAVMLPLAHGDWLNAAFYKAIEAAQPELAAQLHASDGRKPFTLSLIQGLPQANGRTDVHLPVGWRCWFRLTMVNSEVLDAFIQRLLTVVNVELRVGRARFIIEEVLGTPGSHDWAGYTTTEALRQQVRRRESVRIQFLSPTAFSRIQRADNGRHIYSVIPEPTLVWSSLRSVWKHVTGEVIADEFEPWVERNVVISQVHQWKTVIMPFQRGPVAGGLGEMTYRCLMPEHPWLATWCWLADFAFYSGVGYKTTQGMGQCRVVTRD